MQRADGADRHRRPGRVLGGGGGAATISTSTGGNWTDITARHIRRRPSRVPRLPLQLERRQRARHGPDHRARDRRCRRHLGRGRSRRRLAAERRLERLDCRSAMVSSRSRPATSEYSNGVLWYATGEANTGAESYVGAGVYVLTNPTSNTSWTRVGGNELESTTIGRLRFDKTGSKVWAASLRGVWWHTTASYTGPGSWPSRRTPATCRARSRRTPCPARSSRRRRSAPTPRRRRRRRTRTSSTMSPSIRTTRATSSRPSAGAAVTPTTASTRRPTAA